MAAHIRRYAVLVVVLVALLAGCDWQSYMGPLANGFTADQTPAAVTPLTLANIPTLSKKWTAGSGGAVFAQPIVANGTVYWGSSDGYERATDLHGNLRWRTYVGVTTPGGTCFPASVGVASTAMYRTDVTIGTSNAILFVGGGDGNLYALDAETGAVLWATRLGATPDNFVYDSPRYDNGSIYIGVSSYGDCPYTQGKFFKINPVTGAIENTANLTPNGCVGAGVWGSAAIDDTTDGGVAYVVTGNYPSCPQGRPFGEAIVEVSLADLHIVDSWAIPPAEQIFDGDFGSSPNLFTATINGTKENVVGVVSKNGIYYAFARDAIGSGPVWETRIATGGAAPLNGHGTIATGAWDSVNHRLYLAGDAVTIAGTACKGSISAVNPNDGSFLWRDCLNDGWVMGAVTAAAKGFAIVGEGTHLIIVNTSNGQILWNYTGPGKFQGPATLANGVIYATDNVGNLSAFAPAPAIAVPLPPPNSGYWMLGADGVVYPFGGAAHFAGSVPHATAMTPRRDGKGYWVVDSRGHVFTYGTPYKGGAPALAPFEIITTIAATPSNNGYWLISNRGRVFPFGDAKFLGDMSKVRLNGPVVASVATPTGHGYYMVGTDGGIFTFGDAHFRGSMASVHLNKPIVGLSPTPNNAGYWLVASDGGVFAFNAPFRGSMGGTRLNKPVNGLVAFGNGYLMVASDGGIFDFSNKPFFGSLAGRHLSAPIIGVAAFST